MRGRGEKQIRKMDVSCARHVEEEEIGRKILKGNKKKDK